MMASSSPKFHSFLMLLVPGEKRSIFFLSLTNQHISMALTGSYDHAKQPLWPWEGQSGSYAHLQTQEEVTSSQNRGDKNKRKKY